LSSLKGLIWLAVVFPSLVWRWWWPVGPARRLWPLVAGVGMLRMLPPLGGAPGAVALLVWLLLPLCAA
jgi:hypothetical protein